jgi:putative redox protein
MTDPHPAPKAGPITPWSIRWTTDHVFEAGPPGRTHLIDGDSKIAPGPVETLLGAILSCSGVDVVDILAKRRTPVSRFEARVKAYRRADHPRRVMRLELEYHVDGAGIDPDAAERAIELAFEKYCTVAASLGADIVTTSQLILNGEAKPPRPRKMWTTPT